MQSAGSALAAVLITTGVFAVLTASMLRYTISERRGNERNRLMLRAKTMSESISSYAAEQITTKLYRVRSTSPVAFMTGVNAVDLPPLSLLQTLDSAYTSGGNMEALAGLTGSTGQLFIDPGTSPTDPNAGLQVNTATVPIIAKATARHAALGSIPVYTQLNLAVDLIPLFQFAVFYNMDLEIWPGEDLTLTGPVNCNGDICARGSGNIQFTDRVSTAKGFYADSGRVGGWISASGTVDNGPGGSGMIRFQHSTTRVVTDIKSGSVYRDHKYGGATETTSTLNQFKVFANTTYGLNLRTSVHGVTPMVLPGVNNYNKTNISTTPEDERNNGRQVIEIPSVSDSASLRETKIARKAGLYIIVNPDSAVRNGRLPDGSSVSMRGRSYRCFLNTINADLTHTIQEVVLPGQPSYGPLNVTANNLPNSYVTSTSIGHNQVLRTIQGGAPDAANTGYAVVSTPTTASFSDAYFYDLRRAQNNSGATAQISTGSFRASHPYTPRPIVKIDFDMTRFRMMVERTMSGVSLSYVASATTTSVYDPSTPNSGNWANSIYNSAAVRASPGLGLTSTAFTTLPTASTKSAPDPYRMYFAPADPSNPVTAALIATNPGSFAVGATDLALSGFPKPWFDGITVYVHSVDAEDRSDISPADGVPDRIDSAVRLWNGRGPAASLNTVSYPNMAGFTFVTNDAAYIVGHFNADGTINAVATSTTNPGGYSARYPDSNSENLCAVMADAITILSAPVCSTTSSYAQTSGWSDSLSAHRISSSSWSSAWATTQPGGSNNYDGVATSIKPAALPNLGNINAGPGSTRDYKFGVTVTEVSTCLLMGIVPTNHDPTGLTAGPPSTGPNGQSSGGLHNFPRLLEAWPSNVGLYIRGSMVAMFESRVAMEPWSLRIYTWPDRLWGLHEYLRTANHHLPLEPLVILARRLGFKEITAAEYTSMAATIRALPH